MKKYAAIPINSKYEKDGKHIRRVLISYEDVSTEDYYGFPTEFFSGTKLLAKDPYFEDKSRSHQYIFDDDGYILLQNNSDSTKKYEDYKEMYEKRRYHIYMAPVMNPLTAAERRLSKIKAKNDEEAIKIFNERKELRN